MNRDGTLKRQIVLGILALCGLAMVAACAGAPADSDTGRQTVPAVDGFVDTFENIDAPSSSGPVVLATRFPSLRQAPAPAGSDGGVQRPTTQQAPAPAVSGEAVQRPTTTSNQQSEAGSQDSGGTQQTEYTWQDGGRTQTVILQPDLVIDDGSSTKGAMAQAPGGAIVKSADAQGQSTGQPVFKSQSGALMSLPGGVLVVLDPDWTQAQVDAFFSSNAIKLSRVEELGYLDNGYFIETEPGFPSLDLANALAELEGVIVSSPNWWMEVSLK